MARRKAKKKRVKTMLTAEKLMDKPLNQHCLDLHEKLAQQVKDAGFTDEELFNEIKKIRKDVRRDRSKRKG
mgnify:CR=1 FL=1|jgi:hypothetical protein